MMNFVTFIVQKGGWAGIRNLVALNKSCWVRDWKFLNVRDKLWKKALEGKFRNWGGMVFQGQYSLFWGEVSWNDMRKGWDLFQVLTYLSVGNEHRMNFWLDLWCGIWLILFCCRQRNVNSWSLVFGRWFWEGRNLFQVLSCLLIWQRTTSD